MRIFSQVRPAHPEKAFDALWTEEGASHFSSIGTYKTYVKESRVVRTSFRSFGATIEMKMLVLPTTIMFETTAPFVKANGTWTMKRGLITLEQTVSCPCFAVPVVRRCVRKTLKELARIK